MPALAIAANPSNVNESLKSSDAANSACDCYISPLASVSYLYSLGLSTINDHLLNVMTSPAVTDPPLRPLYIACSRYNGEPVIQAKRLLPINLDRRTAVNQLLSK